MGDITIQRTVEYRLDVDAVRACLLKALGMPEGANVSFDCGCEALAGATIKLTTSEASLLPDTRRRLRGIPTIKSVALEAVRASATPLTVNEIRAIISGRLGRSIARTSISPQLTRLQRSGLVRRDGRLWSASNASQSGDAA